MATASARASKELNLGFGFIPELCGAEGVWSSGKHPDALGKKTNPIKSPVLDLQPQQKLLRRIQESPEFVLPKKLLDLKISKPSETATPEITARSSPPSQNTNFMSSHLPMEFFGGVDRVPVNDGCLDVIVHSIKPD